MNEYERLHNNNTGEHKVSFKTITESQIFSVGKLVPSLFLSFLLPKCIFSQDRFIRYFKNSHQKANSNFKIEALGALRKGKKQIISAVKLI